MIGRELFRKQQLKHGDGVTRTWPPTTAFPHLPSPFLLAAIATLCATCRRRSQRSDTRATRASQKRPRILMCYNFVA
jgi:hypothetical protein